MSDQVPMPLAAFAATLRPKVTATRSIAPRQGQAQSVNVVEAGSPHEVWIHWLRINHAGEKHTAEDWQKLIDDYAQQPAHEADPNFVPGA